MKSLILSAIVFFIASCSGVDVKQKSQVSFDTLYVSKVVSRKEITLKPNESKSGRILVGLISAGPVGAIATANTEKGFSEPKAFEYTLSLQSGKVNLVISRSIAEIGNCVEVISPDDSEIELLRVISSEQCSGSDN